MMDLKALSKLGLAMLSGAVGFVEALHGTVTADEIKVRALRAIEANREAVEAAEALERKIFEDGSSE